MTGHRGRSHAIRGTSAALALSAAATGAVAGGFDLREQSTYFQGMSYAGSAAGGSNLSSIFWNPASATFVGAGLTTTSSYSLIIPRADVTIDNVNVGGTNFACGSPPFAGDCSVDVGDTALVPASYAAWRFDSKTVFALSLNSQFGLGTEPDNNNWVGAPLASHAAKLTSYNAVPTIAYEVMPGVSVGAGVQIQYLDLEKLQSLGGVDLSGDGVPDVVGNTKLKGDGWGVGWTIGVNFQPAPGTSIGIGYRSSIDHDLDGSLSASGDLGVLLGPGGLGVLPASISAEIETPDKVTGSFRQVLSSTTRLLGTVEWTNWSKLDVIPIVGTPTPTALDFQWHDGWLFSLGGEYDVSSVLTLRAGVAYEISPIQNASERLVQLPDADRVWLSAGGSYNVGNLWGGFSPNAQTTIDFAYSHVFIEDSDFSRSPAAATPIPLVYSGTVDASADIISLGMTTKW